MNTDASGARGHFPHIVSATRLHLPADAFDIPETTQEHLRAYVLSSQRLGVVASIAVNSHLDTVKRIAEEAAPGYKVHVLHVPCWGAFVPALNTLLEFAKRNGMKYILYQSLEVQCNLIVLQKLLGHFNSNVLVVGPRLPGHTFQSGEQPLNGRTTPWNTLALWSVRKLALTGFLHIADGIAANTQSDPRLDNGAVDSIATMGSDGWWTRQISEPALKEVPAGVEEVTAVALIQHLLGTHRAIAVLLELSDEVAGQISWKTNWGQDERRKQWHEYKMMSKVTRPAAQMQELFRVRKRASTFSCLWQSPKRTFENDKTSQVDGVVGGAEAEGTLPNSGLVMHFTETVRPPPEVLKICLIAVGLFYANSTAVLASAFQYINANSVHTSVAMLAFVTLLIGGVYIMMPVSLKITRTVTVRLGHRAGLLFFAATLLASHICIIISQLLCEEPWQQAVLLCARITQGLGSGVLFQSRFVLASLSTSDQHMRLQAQMFIAGDLGLGLGALLPAATSIIVGYQELRADGPELWPSGVLAVIFVAFLVWIMLAFPRHLHFLPEAVRFVDRSRGNVAMLVEGVDMNADMHRKIAWISGTMRVFVQSAIMPAVALLMHDMSWTGNFRQSFAVAALSLLAIPFEVVGSRICCVHSVKTLNRNNTEFRKFVSSLVGAAVFLFSAAWPNASIDDQNLVLLLRRVMELVVLVVALSLAAPFHASRLYQLPDAERSTVLLEWLKAYVGRLFGPFVAVIMYTWLGYGPLLTLLSLSTMLVTITA